MPRPIPTRASATSLTMQFGPTDLFVFASHAGDPNFDRYLLLFLKTRAVADASMQARVDAVAAQFFTQSAELARAVTTTTPTPAP